ncbi:MAG: transposase [bacterium]|nr:transposase [bacterium]
MTLMRYIELNPVRAGMVEQPADYPWSSHRRNAQGESGLNAQWISSHDEYLRLGQNDVERQEIYRDLFRTAISAYDLREIRECTHKGWALGNERFRERVEVLGQRRAMSKGVGRPKKKEKGIRS